MSCLSNYVLDNDDTFFKKYRDAQIKKLEGQVYDSTPDRLEERNEWRDKYINKDNLEVDSLMELLVQSHEKSCPEPLPRKVVKDGKELRKIKKEFAEIKIKFHKASDMLTVLKANYQIQNNPMAKHMPFIYRQIPYDVDIIKYLLSIRSDGRCDNIPDFVEEIKTEYHKIHQRNIDMFGKNYYRKALSFKYDNPLKYDDIYMLSDAERLWMGQGKMVHPSKLNDPVYKEIIDFHKNNPPTFEYRWKPYFNPFGGFMVY